MNEVALQRWECLLTTCFDLGKGTLWQVREDIWQAHLRLKHYRSNRVWHPGLSLMERKLENSREYIPMLHGTTDTRGPVVVKGITTDKGEDHTTSFGRTIRPTALPVVALIPGGPVKEEIPRTNPLRKCGIHQNIHKPRITDDELQHLNAWLGTRGMR